MKTFAALLVLSISVAAWAQRTEQVPRIGLAGHELDACLSVGEVTGLDPQGDNFLAVRALPSADGAEKDRLDSGRWLWLCDAAGEWLGVVYSPDPTDKPGDCGVGSPVETTHPYVGRCHWGWVHSRYVTVIAG